MNSWRGINLKLFTACFVAASLFCSSAFSDEFYPTDEILATSNIYLDSSRAKHPIIDLNFPSPSEYKAKNAPVNNAFTPPADSQKVITPQEPPKELPNIPETNAETKQEKTMDFSDMDFFAPPPSEYKKETTEEILPAPPKENPQDKYEKQESYYASAAQTSENFQDYDIEGKVISDIHFSGLRLVDENAVLNVMSTRNGAAFNIERLQQDLQNIYETGYFTDSMHIEPTLNADDTITLEVILKENPEVKDVVFIGNTVFSSNELSLFTKELKGMPQNLYSINKSIAEINKYYEDKGYILAKVTSVDDNSDGVLILQITEGVIEKITFEGNKKTKDFVIERNILTQAGSVYNEEMLKKDLSKVYATQIFEDVNRRIDPSPDVEGEYIVTIVVKEASSDSISIGGGIDNALGVFGSINIQDKNFLGRAQQIGLSGMIGSGILMSDASIKNRINYQVELNFLEPYLFNENNSLSSKIYFRELGSYKIPLAVERRFGFNGIIKHKVKNSDTITTNFGFGFENINLREGDAAKIAQQYANRNMNLALRKKQLIGGNFINFAPGVQYSTVDSEFMPREGIKANASFIEALAVDHMKNTNGRFVGSITKYIPVFKKSTLLVGAKGGIKVHGSNMPEVMAFTLGGPYSIRGFRMSGVGSGESFLMGSAELQTPVPFMDRFKYDVLKNLRFAFFIDAGKLWDPTVTSRLYDRPNSAITAGVGLRVNIPGMGPISVDYGLPLTNVGHYNKQHGYFTFGTGGLYDSSY